MRSQKFKKILFVGLGGAGQRHLRIFRNLLPAGTGFSAFRATGKTPLLRADFSIDSSATLEEKYNLKIFKSLEEAFDNHPDVVVISNPTSLHFDVAQQAARKGINLFVEKPFSHNLEGFADFRETVISGKIKFFIAYQRRFHPQLQKVKELIIEGALGKLVSATFNVGSYVPAWHSYEDFRNLYACRKDLGGGVLLTEIHELDLCYWFFGIPEAVYCTGGNFSNVPMDVEDTAHVVLKYRDFSSHVNLCFVQKHVCRDLTIVGTDGYLEWNQAENRLFWVDYKKNRPEILTDPSLQMDTLFKKQASYFLEKMELTESVEQLNRAWASLAIVETAKESMIQKREIRI